MPITLDGTNGITTPTYGGTDTSEYLVPVTQFKNRIINGAMVIDQRNAGASVTPAAGDVYTLDRWKSRLAQSSKLSFQQNAGSVTPPAGFKNYLGATSLAATSLGSNDYYTIQQDIEGFNVADLDWGTANAKTVTLSFWVRSSLTGTFGGAFINQAYNRCYPFTYTISAANTWEQKSVTVAGDTTGTWLTTNGVGVQVVFSLGMGSAYSGTAGAWTSSTVLSATGATSVVGTNGASWYVTGCQLEIGSTATSFDYRPYGTELALCQRYYQKIGGSSSGYQFVVLGSGWAGDASTAIFNVFLPVSMRTAPTLGTSGTAGDYQWRGYSPVTATPNAVPFSTEVGILGGRVDTTFAASLTAGSAGSLRTQANNGYLSFSAEL